KYRKTGVLPAETTEYVKRFSSIYSPGTQMADSTTLAPSSPSIPGTARGSRETTTTSSRNIPEDFKQGMLDASEGLTDFTTNASAQIGDLSKQLLSNSESAKTAAAAEGEAKGQL